MKQSGIVAEKTLESKKVLEGITGLDDLYKNFYYDETNNYRKFHLISGRLNVEDAGEFILGGIVVENDQLIDISALKSEIRLDQSTNELKFKHVARGGLGDVLKSKRIRTILEFIKEERIDIHFQRVNSFYWGIIDIIESINLPSELILIHWEIKDFLYCALVSNLCRTINILHTYNYPDIQPENISEFYKCISFCVRNYNGGNAWIRDALLCALELGRRQDEAVFIQNEDELVLVNDYSHYYRDRVLTFPNSTHIIDMEPKVKESLDRSRNIFNNKTLLNYKFVESHESDGVQLSDVVVGLLSKIINFCNNRSTTDLISLRRSYSGTEKIILDLLEDIIFNSESKCRAYFNNIVPLSKMGSYGGLLRKVR